MVNFISSRLALAPAIVALSFAVPCAAQDSAGVRSQYETRSELEMAEHAAEAQHRTSEAWLLRNRLQNGDFQDGDRIVLVVQGNSALSDTLTVRAGKVLQIPRMEDLPLQGVLRSELPQKITAHLAEYLKDPTSRVTPLLRIGVLGHVQRPGYYYTSADVLLTDVVMRAGGPATDADMQNIVIRRGPDVIWSAADTRTALTDGLSLDRLHLRAGDEIDISGQHHISWGTIVPVGVSLLTAVVALIRFH
jgi:protein involved in polysaccharide export with SLBB domain